MKSKPSAYSPRSQFSGPKRPSGAGPKAEFRSKPAGKSFRVKPAHEKGVSSFVKGSYASPKKRDSTGFREDSNFENSKPRFARGEGEQRPRARFDRDSEQRPRARFDRDSEQRPRARFDRDSEQRPRARFDRDSEQRPRARFDRDSEQRPRARFDRDSEQRPRARFDRDSEQGPRTRVDRDNEQRPSARFEHESEQAPRPSRSVEKQTRNISEDTQVTAKQKSVPAYASPAKSANNEEISSPIPMDLNWSETLSLPLAQALSVLNFKTPTPIQQQAIPIALSGADLIGCAQTGTGKTFAFCLPILQRMIEGEKQDSKALILAPTREIAIQIVDAVKTLTKFLPKMKTALLIGGVPYRMQMRDLAQEPRIIIATPGRLIDVLGSRANLFSKIGFVAIDEADRMFDMGFAPQVKEVMRTIPKERQILLFTATLTKDVEALAKTFLRSPQKVSVGRQSKPIEKIHQTTIETQQKLKDNVLVDQLNARKGTVLIFTRTKQKTDQLANHLKEYGFAVDRIHGDRSQGQRNSAMQMFRSGKIRILVATDIAARGLDIPHIAHVINYDLPQCPEDYVHRIGRTARAGKEGEALSLITPQERRKWSYILRLIK